MEKLMRIENWAFVIRGDSYSAPEQLTQHLTGNVFGHTRHEDGKFVETSTVEQIDLENGIVITRNSTYILGTPDSKWVEWISKNDSRWLEKLKGRYM
jgi:hypothetical protein